MSPRRFSSAQRSGSIPVSRTISDDLPWSTWPAVATTRSAAGGAASILVDVVTLEGVLDRAREVGELVREHGPHVEQRRVGLDAAEHRRAAARAAGPRTRPDPPSSRPRPTTASSCRASNRRRPRTGTCGRARPRGRRRATPRAGARASTGRPATAKSIRRTGSSSSRPDACIARTASSAAICILSTRTARAIGCARSLATTSARPTTIPACGPPSSLSPEHVTRSAPSASASATDGSSGGMPCSWCSSPEPTSKRNGMPRLAASAARSLAGGEAVNPTTR